MGKNRKIKEIKIGNKIIGENKPVFIIAEAGVNHNGNFNLAKRLVIEAKKAGADCIKFQTFKAENLVTEKSPKAAYQILSTNARESQKIMLKKLELKEKDFFKLKKLCDKLNIIFLSTPYNFEDVDFLKNMGVAGYKLASMHLTEIPSIEYVAKTQKPAIISTGMSRLSEIKKAVKAFRKAGNRNLILLQCTTNYPSKIEHLNLRAMDTIRKNTGAVVGYSDHALGIEAPVIAVAAGAKVIEKHFTLNKKMKGPDHLSSADPKEFKEMVKRIKLTEIMLGNSKKEMTPPEIINRKGMKRSLTALVPIRVGDKIKTHMVGFKRPMGGLSPNFYYKIIGRRAKRNIKKDQILTRKDI